MVHALYLNLVRVARFRQYLERSQRTQMYLGRTSTWQGMLCSFSDALVFEGPRPWDVIVMAYDHTPDGWRYFPAREAGLQKRLQLAHSAEKRADAALVDEWRQVYLDACPCGGYMLGCVGDCDDVFWAQDIEAYRQEFLFYDTQSVWLTAKVEHDRHAFIRSSFYAEPSCAAALDVLEEGDGHGGGEIDLGAGLRQRGPQRGPRRGPVPTAKQTTFKTKGTLKGFKAAETKHQERVGRRQNAKKLDTRRRNQRDAKCCALVPGHAQDFEERILFKCGCVDECECDDDNASWDADYDHYDSDY